MNRYASPPTPANAKIDLVTFGELKLFMYEEDNLYQIGVPEPNRRQDLRAHYRQVAANGWPKSPLNPGNIEQNTETKYFFHTYLWHLHQVGLAARLLDVGAFVGDFALSLASFARTCNLRFQATCFDPSVAGTLVPFNIDLNGLGEFVDFEPLAATDVDGPVKFSYHPGHMDSAAIAYGQTGAIEYLANGVRLSTYIHTHAIRSEGLIVKIDTEGLEIPVIQDLFTVVSPPTIIFEFSPGNMHQHGFDALALLRQFPTWYHLYDVSHVPVPGRVRRIADDQIGEFVARVGSRACGYADVLLVPKTLPGFEALSARIDQMEKGQRGYFNFVGASQGGEDW